jgi:hypothetical protein
VKQVAHGLLRIQGNINVLTALQTLGGLVVQRNENQALLIWDHGVLMREKVCDHCLLLHL